MARIHRRDLVVAAAAGTAGGAGGLFGYWGLRGSPFAVDATPSYSQSGEDAIIKMIFDYLKVRQPSYLDIGAWHPRMSNNTYLFYTQGGRGVLVEPNVAMIAELKIGRPDDIVLNVGIGVTALSAARYYCMTNSQLNTFNKQEAERTAALTPFKIQKVVTMPLVPINKIITEHFRGGSPDFISIDVEGMDTPIMKTLDFERFRPKVICAETLVAHTFRMNPEMTEFLGQKGYEARAMTYANTIYVDKSLVS